MRVRVRVRDKENKKTGVPKLQSIFSFSLAQSWVSSGVRIRIRVRVRLGLRVGLGLELGLGLRFRPKACLSVSQSICLSVLSVLSVSLSALRFLERLRHPTLTLTILVPLNPDPDP